MDLFPPLPRESWASTRETLHRFLQIIGKVRLAASVRRNHWWNVPFHLTGNGITTRPSGPLGDGTVFTVDFDFTTHRLRVLTLARQAAKLEEPATGHLSRRRASPRHRRGVQPSRPPQSRHQAPPQGTETPPA